MDLTCSRGGLSDEDVRSRLARFGPNEIPETARSLLFLFLRQFQSVLVYILLGALALSIVLPLYERGGVLGLEDFLDAIAIGAILLLNATLGFFQERRAERSIALLKQLSEPTVRVRRLAVGAARHCGAGEGIVRIVPSRELVPGDLLLLEEGDRVSADGRIIMARNAEIDEASLTGESKPARKTSEVLGGSLAVADQRNMVFRGTTVTRGRLEVCITATGIQTEIGKIAALVQEVEHPPTPLETSMAVLGRWLGVVVLFACIAIFLLGGMLGMSLSDMLLTAASLAVSAVPEGLPAIVTVTLALGVQRMLRRRALTRELQAVETLGSVTVICTDKTGTITENDMEVQELWLAGRTIFVEWAQGNQSAKFRGGMTSDLALLLKIGASCNNAASLDIGDPTEIALLEVAHAAGVRRLLIEEEEVPFNSEQKYMMTSHGVRERRGEPKIKYMKGATEVVVSLCTHVLRDGEVQPLADDLRRTVLVKNAEMAARALRVLAMAYKDDGRTIIVGLTGMLDPPRDGVREAVAVARKAGIRTVIITGDHALTAKAIAEKVGVVSEVVTGDEIEKLSLPALQERLKTISLFARVSPAHKVKILDALQAQGEIVAMGGDGVNDAPALKKAHVGFAMGIQGTDVARETAQMVLTDDHFATVVEAIEEGRTIYDNIRKFVTFLLRANFDELVVVFGAIILGLPLPYLPIHLLLINLVTDSLPAMALAMEQPEPNVMERPPRNPKVHILQGEYVFIVLAAAIAAIAAFQVFTWGLRHGDLVLARTMNFTTSVLFELALVFTCRSRRSLLAIGPFSNRYLLGANTIAFVVLLLVLYTPLAPYLHLVPLTASQWVLPLLWSFGALLFFEVLKLLPRKAPAVLHRA